MWVKLKEEGMSRKRCDLIGSVKASDKKGTIHIPKSLALSRPPLSPDITWEEGKIYRQSGEYWLNSYWQGLNIQKEVSLNNLELHILRLSSKNWTYHKMTKQLLKTFEALVFFFFFINLPGGAVVKIPLASAGDSSNASLSPGSGSPPRVGNGNPLQYSCLKNYINRGAWPGHSPWGHKKLEATEWPSMHMHTHTSCILRNQCEWPMKNKY